MDESMNAKTAMYPEPGAAPERAPEFYEAVSLLDDAITRLDLLTDALKEKLMPISSPVPPEPVPEPEPDSRFQTSVARTIETHFLRVDHLTDVVASMTKRAEL
jgi:hypothetical protein